MKSYSQLADLEALLLKIQDENSRAYASEAVASYSGGAYRAAIVTIWIATIYDLYQKFRYLSEQFNDLAAKKCLEEIESIRSNPDKKQVSIWERTILNKAFNDIKMITEIEFDLLSRIQQDRHRCAHPVLDSEGLLFQPSPELVRSHIRTAIDILLSQPPIIGKASIEALVRDVEGKFFPIDPDGVLRFLKGRHLPMSEKYRSNLMKFSIKKILYLPPDLPEIVKRYIHVFQGLILEHRQTFESLDKNTLTTIISSIKEDRFSALAALLYIEGDLWQVVPTFIQEKFKIFIDDQATLRQKLYVIHVFPDLMQALLDKYQCSNAVDKYSLIFELRTLKKIPGRSPSFLETIISDAINRFSLSSSYQEAKSKAGGLIQPIIHLMSENNINQLLEEISQDKNRDQLVDCAGLMYEIFIKTIDNFPQTISAWKDFIEAKKGIWSSTEDLEKLIEAFPDHQELMSGSIKRIIKNQYDHFDV